MPKITLKTLFVVTAFGAMAIPAIAQRTIVTETVNVPTRSIDADFAVADINQDGALDRDEFVSFAVIKSDAGDEDFRAIVSMGKFDEKFAVHDHDADGHITVDEMGLVKEGGEVMIEKPALDTDADTDIEPVTKSLKDDLPTE